MSNFQSLEVVGHTRDCFVSVLSLCLSCRRSNTRRWPNVGLLLAHRLRWANNEMDRSGGWVLWALSTFFWMSGIVLTLQGSYVLSCFLYCILYVLWMYIYIYIWNVKKIKFEKKTTTCRYLSMKYWLGLNGYWPALATLAQHLTDIGLVSACNRRQQY